MTLEIRDDRENGGYAAYLDGQRVGAAELEAQGDEIVLTHTEVDPAHEGKGIASALARRVFDDARAEGRAVRPQCPYMRRWAERHGEDYPNIRF